LTALYPAESKTEANSYTEKKNMSCHSGKSPSEKEYKISS